MDCLRKSQKASWDMMLRHVSNAVLFLDNISAECLHWSIGVNAVFDAGATNIKDFTAFECGDDGDKKAVFVLSNLLLDNVQETVYDIVKASSFHECTVISSTKPAVLAKDETADKNIAFDQIQQRIQYYMNNMQATCDVCFLPLMEFSITSNLFLMPSLSDLFPMLVTDIRKFKGLSPKVCEDDMIDIVNDVHFEMLPLDLQAKFKMLIVSLDNLCERLEINEDIYCIGPTSQLIATELAALSSAKLRRRSAVNRAALVVVDRTLDLAGSVSHSHETLADKIFGLLPRLQGHKNDVAIDMSMLCSAERYVFESLMEVNRQIVDLITKEKLHSKASMKMGRGVELLKSNLNVFSVEKTPEVFERNCGLLQLSVGCLQALQHEQYEKHQFLEKMIIQSSSNFEDSRPYTHLHDAYSKQDRQFNAEDLLRNLIHLYSLHGNSVVSKDEEEELQQLLLNYILKIHQADSSHPYFVGCENDSRGVDDIFNKLNAIGMTRDHLKQFRNVIHDGNKAFPSTYKPLLQDLAEQIVDPSKPDLPDLQHRSTGLRDRIKTSFRLFMNVSKPRPSDHPLLIIYVIGGVTCSEVRAINEVSAKTSQEILLGSTCLLKPTDVVDMVFSNNSNNF
ncbi:sec1 family domain-containing protein 2-like [Anneissia japonica]|uniref:sec1 family domain-containing protein 2-like n=1 Tax=Anneissia japonica TaxID=1529436 RepID=UPI001425A429|nr:sec1 family domain-containing protein 2-like [Anneissia japonica]